MFKIIPLFLPVGKHLCLTSGQLAALPQWKLAFVAVEMLLSPFAPFQVIIMTLLIQARHLFYGLSMLDRFKNTGWKKYYLIFGMCDECFL